MLGLLDLRIIEATGADIEALGEIRGQRVLCIHSKGDKVALPPPAACGSTGDGPRDRRPLERPLLRGRTGRRMDRHAATRRLRALASIAGVSTERMRPQTLRQTHLRHNHARRRRRPQRRPDRSTPRRPRNHYAVPPGTNKPRPPSQRPPRRFHFFSHLRDRTADERARDQP
jgi:hypothetical protein